MSDQIEKIVAEFKKLAQNSTLIKEENWATVGEQELIDFVRDQLTALTTSTRNQALDDALAALDAATPKQSEWYCPNCDGDSYKMKCVCTPEREAKGKLARALYPVRATLTSLKNTSSDAAV